MAMRRVGRQIEHASGLPDWIEMVGKSGRARETGRLSA